MSTPTATPHTDDTPYQATPSADLRQQIMDSRVPKNEREWWAQRTIEKLETELAAAKAECNLNRTRIASLFWSGVMDKYTGSDVQEWAANYTAELARLRAEVERLKAPRSLFVSASIYEDALARAERAEADRNEFFRDTARLDWLQAHALPQHSPNISISDLGRHYNGFPGSFRAAIDAAMKGTT